MSSRSFRLLVYGLNYAPELTGVGKYTGEMCEWLAGRGYEIRVITAPPYYPMWKIGNGYSGYRYTRESINGVDVWRCPLWVPRYPDAIRRVIHLTSFAIFSLPVVLMSAWWRPHIVMVVEPTAMCIPGALILAALSGAKSWLHIQDFEVDAAFQLGLLKNVGRARRAAFRLESWLMRKFDRISTISGQMVARAVEKIGGNGKTPLLFLNWVDIEKIYPLDYPSPLMAQLGCAEGEVVVLYSGNMGEKQGLEVLLRAADRLKNLPTVRFILCGDGAAHARLQDEARRLSLLNVQFLPLRPSRELNALLNFAEIHVLVQKEQAMDLLLPSKLTGIMASGRPVVATAAAGTAVAEMILEARCGEVVPPESAETLAQAIETLAGDPERRNLLGRGGREFALRRLNKKIVLGEIERSLSELMGR